MTLLGTHRVCCARLDGLSERFRRIAMSSDLVLMSVLGEPRTQWFFGGFFPGSDTPANGHRLVDWREEIMKDERIL